MCSTTTVCRSSFCVLFVLAGCPGTESMQAFTPQRAPASAPAAAIFNVSGEHERTLEEALERSVNDQERDDCEDYRGTLSGKEHAPSAHEAEQHAESSVQTLPTGLHQSMLPPSVQPSPTHCADVPPSQRRPTHWPPPAHPSPAQPPKPSG